VRSQQDYRLEEVVGRELVEANGGRVVLIPLLPAKNRRPRQLTELSRIVFHLMAVTERSK